MKIVKRKIAELRPAEYNPRKLTAKQEEDLMASLTKFGLVDPILINTNPKRKDIVIGGHQRMKVWQKMGNTEIDCVELNLTIEKEKELNVRLNKNTGEFDLDILHREFAIEDLIDWGFEPFEIEIDTSVFDSNEPSYKEEPAKLSDRFIVPPFSILDTRQGYWQDRKREWLSLGIKSEEGRSAQSVKFSAMAEDLAWGGQRTGISIFDPVLTEISYLWFNVPNGKILDPFAGGSVRGIVASKLGYEYFGNDLREEQIEANYENASEVLTDDDIAPKWTAGDSLEIDTIAQGYEADMIFSCPPYADLEVYSDDERDISNMEYDEFLSTYREIIKKSCTLLKVDRFAVFVVGDVRDKDGVYRNFISHTIDAFIDCGLSLYNSMILSNSVGAKAIGQMDI